MTYALHTEFFSSFLFFYRRHHRNQRKSEAPRFYVLRKGFHALFLSLSLSLTRSLSHTKLMEEEEKIV